jgi:DNA polymerase-3 subunit delta
MGEESFFIDQLSDYIEHNVLDEAEKEFNQQVLYGLETDVLTIAAEAKRFPMMANHNVVIVKEAQNLKKIDELAAYAEQPLASTLLVLCYKYGKVDKRKAFVKAVAKNGVVFESKKLYDNQVPAWIDKYVAELKFKISPKVALQLADFLGNDLSKIANEIEKLSINMQAGDEITAALVEKNIGLSKEYNYFELNNALGTRNVLKSNQIINYFSGNEKKYPFPVIIGSLYRYFSQLLNYQFLKDKSRNAAAAVLKVHPFFMKDYEIAARNYSIKKVVAVIAYLREYDIKSKGVDNTGSENSELLRELIFKILH